MTADAYKRVGRLIHLLKQKPSRGQVRDLHRFGVTPRATTVINYTCYAEADPGFLVARGRMLTEGRL